MDNRFVADDADRMLEVEAKLAAPSMDVLDAIAAFDGWVDYRAECRAAESLDTLYVDTPSGALRAAAIAVRFRDDSRGTELTVKREGERGEVVHRRPEWTIRIDSRPTFPWWVEGPLADHLAPLILVEPLVPMLSTRIRRRAVRLFRGNRSAVEIDLDEVQFARDGACSATTFEVEIELVDGEEAELGAIVDELRRRHPLVPSRLSKLERALRWAGLER